MASHAEDLLNRIENVVELSSMCRGEWCRALESNVDILREELETVRSAKPAVSGGELVGMKYKLRDAYRHLGPDIHV